MAPAANNHAGRSDPRRADTAELRHVEELLGAVRRDTRAPPALRARIEAQRKQRAAPRFRPAYGGVLGLAVLLLALVLISPAGTPSAPSLSQAAALALAPASAPPPRPDPSAPTVKLERSLEHVYFPNWSSRLGWRPVGQRVDRLGGRLAITVYYGSAERRVAYTILAAPALAQPPAPVARVAGTELRTLAVNGRPVVTWRRAGHTCVLSGAGVPAGELRALAAWRPAGLTRP